MAINKTTLSKLNAIKRKSAQSLPDNPTNQGMSAEQIKNAFWKFVLDNEDSILSELGRIIDESNDELKKKLDIAQSAEKANKTMITDAEGNVTPSDIVPAQQINLGSVIITPIVDETSGEYGIRFSIPDGINSNEGDIELYGE